ncbi:MAG: LysR family transcriptional regulator [Bacteroidales bacterium]|jgi:hypothetical protein|nr:LysR family transcriptional regulator [Bacteroidales bacterium]
MFEDFRLKAFMAVANEGSFTRAAKILGVSQPAVSQNIAEIEKGIGVRLFDRIKGEISLTDTGKSFLQYAENILYWYKAADSMFGKNGKMTVSRPIMIAADSFMASYILPSALRSLMSSWENVKSGFPSFIINAYGKSKEVEPDLKLFVKHRNEGIDWDGVSSLIGVIPASVIVSSSNKKADSSVWQSAFSGLGDIPADGKLAVWTPYEQFLSLDITAMTVLQSDSIESILSLVGDSSDFIGVVPYASGKTCPGTRILPVPLPHLQFDVHFQPSTRFAGTGICSLLHQSVSDSLA